jgi:hypothetical protein
MDRLGSSKPVNCVLTMQKGLDSVERRIIQSMKAPLIKGWKAPSHTGMYGTPLRQGRVPLKQGHDAISKKAVRRMRDR